MLLLVHLILLFLINHGVEGAATKRLLNSRSDLISLMRSHKSDCCAYKYQECRQPCKGHHCSSQCVLTCEKQKCTPITCGNANPKQCVRKPFHYGGFFGSLFNSPFSDQSGPEEEVSPFMANNNGQLISIFGYNPSAFASSGPGKDDNQFEDENMPGKGSGGLNGLNNNYSPEIQYNPFPSESQNNPFGEDNQKGPLNQENQSGPDGLYGQVGPGIQNSPIRPENPNSPSLPGSQTDGLYGQVGPGIQNSPIRPENPNSPLLPGSQIDSMGLQSQYTQTGPGSDSMEDSPGPGSPFGEDVPPGISDDNPSGPSNGLPGLPESGSPGNNDEPNGSNEDFKRNCQEGYTYDGEKCVAWFDKPKIWLQALTACMMDGANIVSIKSIKEQNAILKLTGGKKTWIGLKDFQDEGSFTWMNQDPSTFTNWAKGEPSGKDEEDCVAMDARGKWSDNVCREELPYLCQKDPPK